MKSALFPRITQAKILDEIFGLLTGSAAQSTYAYTQACTHRDGGSG